MRVRYDGGLIRGNVETFEELGDGLLASIGGVAKPDFGGVAAVSFDRFAGAYEGIGDDAGVVGQENGQFNFLAFAEGFLGIEQGAFGSEIEQAARDLNFFFFPFVAVPA